MNSVQLINVTKQANMQIEISFTVVGVKYSTNFQ